MAPKYLSRAEAETYIRSKGLRYSAATLSKLASIGGGPVYFKFGNRVVYTADDLDAWIEQKLGPARVSTSTHLGRVAAA